MHEQLCEFRIQHNDATVSKFKQLSSSLHTTFHRNGRIESLIIQPCSSQNGATPFYYETSTLIFKQRNAKIKRLNRLNLISYYIYILYLILLKISMTTFVLYWDRWTAIKTKLVDIGKWPFIQRSAFQHISSTLKQHLNENIGSWRKSFPFLLPLSWPSYIFVERLWPSRIASPTSCASSHLMACRVSDSSRSNRSATLVKRGWKRRWHILFTLDS